MRSSWYAATHVPGALVVNIGSWLAKYTDLRLLATLHLVVGPASEGSPTPAGVRLKAIENPRTSIAMFADADSDVQIENGMTVADYIHKRSGGGLDFINRDGVAFDGKAETERIVLMAT